MSYLDRLDFGKRVAVVVGAGGGRMGSEAAVALAEAGAVVVGLDLAADRMEETATRIRELGGEFVPKVVDILDPEAFSTVLDEIWRDVGPVQHLVHVVGGNRPLNYREGAGVAADRGLDTLDAYTDERFASIVEFNLMTTFRTSREVARRLIEAGLPGTIVTFSGIAALNGSPGIGAYAAAKAAVVSLTRTMAVEWGGHGLRVNSVAPGQTESGRARVGAAFADSDSVDPALYPLGRAADVSDIAAAVLYLSCDLSRSVTGQTVVVDGGATSRMQIFTITHGADGPVISTRWSERHAAPQGSRE